MRSRNDERTNVEASIVMCSSSTQCICSCSVFARTRTAMDTGAYPLPLPTPSFLPRSPPPSLERALSESTEGGEITNDEDVFAGMTFLHFHPLGQSVFFRARTCNRKLVACTRLPCSVKRPLDIRHASHQSDNRTIPP